MGKIAHDGASYTPHVAEIAAGQVASLAFQHEVLNRETASKNAASLARPDVADGVHLWLAAH